MPLLEMLEKIEDKIRIMLEDKLFHQ